MKVVGLDAAAVDADRLADGCAGRQGEWGNALGQGDRTARHERDAPFFGGLDHFLGPVPAVGKVLVVKEGYESVGASHDGDDGVEEPFAGILPLPELVHGVLSVLADGE